MILLKFFSSTLSCLFGGLRHAFGDRVEKEWDGEFWDGGPREK